MAMKSKEHKAPKGQRDERAAVIAALKAKRDLYASVGKDTAALDAQLDQYGAADVPSEPQEPAATVVQVAADGTETHLVPDADGLVTLANANVTVTPADADTGTAGQPAATSDGKEDEVESKKADDGSENTNGTAPLENKANPGSQPARPAAKPGQRPGGQSKG